MFIPVNFLGFYLSPMILYVFWTVPVFIIVRFVLKRCGVLGFVWNLPLFEVAIFFILLALIVLGSYSQ